MFQDETTRGLFQVTCKREPAEIDSPANAMLEACGLGGLAGGEAWVIQTPVVSAASIPHSEPASDYRDRFVSLN